MTFVRTGPTVEKYTDPRTGHTLDALTFIVEADYRGTVHRLAVHADPRHLDNPMMVEHLWGMAERGLAFNVQRARANVEN